MKTSTTAPAFTYIVTTQVLESGFEGQSGSPSILKIESEKPLTGREIALIMKRTVGYDPKIDSLDFRELRDIGLISAVR